MEGRGVAQNQSRREHTVKERMAAVTLLLLRKQKNNRLPHLYELPLNLPYSPELVRLHRALLHQPLDLSTLTVQAIEYNPDAVYLPPHKRGTWGSKDSSPGITKMGNNRSNIVRKGRRRGGKK